MKRTGKPDRHGSFEARNRLDEYDTYYKFRTKYALNSKERELISDPVVNTNRFGRNPVNGEAVAKFTKSFED